MTNVTTDNGTPTGFGECSRCGRDLGTVSTIHADGDGGWMCRVCVNEDKRLEADQEAYEAYLLSGQAFGEDWRK
jgi:hypothetical protein